MSTYSYTRHATRHPPEPSVIQKCLEMLLKSSQEQSRSSIPPTPQGDVDALHAKIKHLDRLAEDTDMVANSFHLTVKREAALLRRERNSLVRLHQLPAEILAMILLNSLDFESGFSQKALQLRAKVSHHWWTIIKSQPRFWTCVGSLDEDIALNIRKAGTLPLQIFSTKDFRPRHGQNIVSLVRAHAPRWFEIKIQSYQKVNPLFKALEGHAFSGLEFLEIEGFDHGVHLELGNIERLRQARLSLIPCVGHGQQQTQPARLLTSLSLALAEYKAYSCPCLVSFLRHCPNLRDLEIRGLCADSDRSGASARSSPPISLPSLRSLSIQSSSKAVYGPGSSILSLIRCPNLTTFKVSHPCQDEGRDQMDAVAIIRQLCAHSQPSVDALPMNSALRNLGKSAYFYILIHLSQVYIMAQNSDTWKSSPIRLEFHMADSPTEILARDVLPYLSPLDIPIEISITSYIEPGTWSRILDGFRNVTILEYNGPIGLVQELLEALSQSSSSPSGGAPRVPRLETLSLDDKYRSFWSANIDQMAPHVAVMLEKRRGLFKSAGMEWQSNFQVKALNSHVFNEGRGAWTQLEGDSEVYHAHME